LEPRSGTPRRYIGRLTVGSNKTLTSTCYSENLFIQAYFISCIVYTMGERYFGCSVEGTGHIIPYRGAQRCSMWPCGHGSCWRMRTNRTQEMPRVPSKSCACMPTPRSLGTVYMAVIQRPGASSRRLKWRTRQLKEKTLTEGSQRNPEKWFVAKFEKDGHGCGASDDEDDDDVL
jgi:hypothetical protein